MPAVESQVSGIWRAVADGSVYAQHIDCNMNVSLEGLHGYSIAADGATVYGGKSALIPVPERERATYLSSNRICPDLVAQVKSKHLEVICRGDYPHVLISHAEHYGKWAAGDIVELWSHVRKCLE